MKLHFKAITVGVLAYVGVLSVCLALAVLFPQIIDWRGLYGLNLVLILTGIVSGYITGNLAVGSGLLNATIVAIIGAFLLPLFELYFGTFSYDGVGSYTRAAVYGLVKPGILCCLAGSVGDFYARKA